MSKRYRSSARPPLPFFVTPSGGRGLRDARPIRPMIRTSAERRSAEVALYLLERDLERHLVEFQTLGVPAPVVARLQTTMEARITQVRGQLAEHDAALAGALGAAVPLSDLGPALIRLRLARGVTQRALAEAIGVHESAISRGERKLHADITVARARAIFEALGCEATVDVSG